MDNNQLNQDMNRLFKAYHPELDTDEIWENIEPFLDKKKKKRRLLFLWWGLGLLGLFVVWPILFMQDGVEEMPANEKTVTKKNVTPLPTNSQALEKASIAPIPEATSTTPPNATALVNPSIRKRNIEFNNTITNTSVKQVNSTPLATTDTSVDAHQATRPTELITNHHALIESIPAISPTTTIADQAEKSVSKKVSRKRKKSRKKIKPRRNKKWNQHLQFYAAPEIAIQQLSPKISSEKEFAQQRKATENPTLSYRIGMNYQLIHREGLILSTGINYEQIKDQFQWSKTESEIMSVIGTVSIVVNAIGDTIRRNSGTITQETTTTKVRYATNKYQFIHLPIGIGFEKDFRRSKMKFTGGINLNLSFSMKGYILDQSDSPTKMFSSGPSSYYHSVFRKKAQLSLWASYEYSKQITPLISWLIAPEIHFPLGSLTTGDYPLKQKYYTLQMRMGVNCLLSTTKNRK